MTKYSQGLNEGTLTSHTTAAAVSQTMTAAQQRVELIARCFAETGVKDLMNMIYEIVQKIRTKKESSCSETNLSLSVLICGETRWTVP